MKTRLEKYNEEEYIPRRTKRNQELYDTMKDKDFDNLQIESNAKVIGENNAIDIEKLKEILEKNYQETPKKRTLKYEEEEKEEKEFEKTREYDINAILEKAKEEKEVDYQEERLKKVRDTQYDILKSLDLKEEPKENDTKEELLELINTINFNENQKKEIETSQIDPLDILSDLKGDDNTVVAPANKLDDKEKEELEMKQALDEDVDNSFYTNSMSFSKKDFASLDEKEHTFLNVMIKILIVLVFIGIVVGVIIFLNEFLNLGWF